MMGHNCWKKVTLVNFSKNIPFWGKWVSWIHLDQNYATLHLITSLKILSGPKLHNFGQIGAKFPICPKRRYFWENGLVFL